MPEPVAWTVTVGGDFANCIEITHCKEDAEAQYEESTAGGFDSLYMLRSLITTDQAEAYAQARVNEALEEAAKVAMNGPITADMIDSDSAKALAFHVSARIRALKKEQP